MISGEDIKNAAMEMLRSIADKAKGKFGVNPEVVQTSSWMIKTSETSSSSKTFTRSVFNKEAVSYMYQIDMRRDFAEKEKLRDLLVEAGVERSHTEYGFLFSLVNSWLAINRPLEVSGQDLERLMENFTSAVIDKRVITRTRYALVGIDMSMGIITLDDGVCIRKILDNELWELGSAKNAYQTSSPIFELRMGLLSPEWRILDISVESKIGKQVTLGLSGGIIKDAVLVALALSSRGRFSMTNLGTTQDIWFGGMSAIPVGSVDNSIGAFSGSSYVIDRKVESRIKNIWAYTSSVFRSSNYLKLPAERLLEGLSRNNMKDAVIDYSVGLEALLTKGANQELSYRFALRGANMICWNGGNIGEWYKKLKDFYRKRSRIVHGTLVNKEDISEAYEIGETALRDILLWYMNNSISSLSQGTRIIDARILT